MAEPRDLTMSRYFKIIYYCISSQKHLIHESRNLWKRVPHIRGRLEYGPSYR